MKKQDEKQLPSYPADSPVSRSRRQDGRKDLQILGISGLKWSELFPKSSPIGCLGRMLPGLSIWGSTKRYLTWSVRATLFKHSYIRLAASARGTSAQELLSWALMFPTPLASDSATNRDAQNLDVFLSEGGIFRKRNRSGAIWSLSLSAAVYYLTPNASLGAALNPDWVEWLMGFPIGWTDVSSGQKSRRESPA